MNVTQCIGFVNMLMDEEEDPQMRYESQTQLLNEDSSHLTLLLQQAGYENAEVDYIIDHISGKTNTKNQ